MVQNTGGKVLLTSFHHHVYKLIAKTNIEVSNFKVLERKFLTYRWKHSYLDDGTDCT